MKGGIGDDVAEREIDSTCIARMTAEVEAARPFVQMRNLEALPRRIPLGEAASEEFSGRSQAAEPEREFETLVPHRSELAKLNSWNDRTDSGMAPISRKIWGKQRAAIVARNFAPLPFTSAKIGLYRPSSRHRRLRRTVTCARGFSRPLRDRVRVGARTERIGEGSGTALQTWPASSR
jgi:hypothetical protein